MNISPGSRIERKLLLHRDLAGLSTSAVASTSIILLQFIKEPGEA